MHLILQQAHRKSYYSAFFGGLSAVLVSQSYLITGGAALFISLANYQLVRLVNSQISSYCYKIELDTNQRQVHFFTIKPVNMFRCEHPIF